MLDQLQQPVKSGADQFDGQNFDLVVIGAGIAGLNALNAATEYLPKGARVLLLDQKDAAGGMWNTAYDYVRLHQPHPMFTVGNMAWDWRKPRDYLAARDEVQSHLASSLSPVGQSLRLQTAFGQTVSSLAEVRTDEGTMAKIVFHANDDQSETQKVHAKQAIHAPGLNYGLTTPLQFSSDNLVSIIPQDLRATLQAHPHAPVVVVGGGKTGMDTVLATLAFNPARRVILFQGRGTNFLNRTKYIPTGIKRWTSGELVSRLFRDMALNFNGDNEDEALAHFRRNYSTDPGANNGVFLYGLQSEQEHTKIKSGVEQAVSDYLEDVVETPDGQQMVLRSGQTMPIDDGAIFVNCTGSFFRDDTLADYQPILSPEGCILSINARSAFHFLTSVSGFFATHLWFRNALRGQGFYTLDQEGLFRQNRNAWVGASAAQAYMNQVIAVQTLPLMLLDRCGLDLDRWYPFPRRMLGLMRMKSTAAADIAHCRRTLDRIADRFDVEAAPLA
ncbi:FAD-dependent oxidoreductase [Yoonia litorea]|uniref:Pyridine nucleotide-disulphide oxidoreductase n=1 Tax=Yoonia litorea TaxID=1123755 RepID=A0A1I6MLE9_9RHOB|nr:FAD-dependent oxidoreductase [Yoonia litorea]SFS16525.1 Pyridine nucleotide-disulphide oxidoreductase [Yoonia litorea]